MDRALPGQHKRPKREEDSSSSLEDEFLQGRRIRHATEHTRESLHDLMRLIKKSSEDTKQIQQGLIERLEKIQQELAIVSDDVERLRNRKTRHAAEYTRESVHDLMRLIKKYSEE